LAGQRSRLHPNFSTSKSEQMKVKKIVLRKDSFREKDGGTLVS